MTATIHENGRVKQGCNSFTESETSSRSEGNNNNSMVVDGGGDELVDLKGTSAPQATGSSSHPMINRAQNRGVNAIVSKAKRAAASLWMVLHAQVRRLFSVCKHQLFFLFNRSSVVFRYKRLIVRIGTGYK
mmetsp:Transcript_46700/g.70509  ORF Transcript_46700/g.70509 Transcript_46700/m.70509 type:complete len:131 (+) Transcript_46700:286-678(+)